MATITSPRAQSPNPSRITSPSLPSVAGTPTSSVRPSIDLPPGSFAATNAPILPGQRRNRAALRDYYNLKSKPSGSTSDLQRTNSVRSNASDSTLASTSTVPADHGGGSISVLPPQIDDPNFDAEGYIAELLKTSTLQDILRAESTLVSEIRNLDGERKALVYDNYSKLIKAVETIGEMQKGMKDPAAGSVGFGGFGGYSGGNASGSTGINAGISGVKGLEDKLAKLIGMVEEMKNERGAGEAQAHARRQREFRDEQQKQDLVKWVLGAPRRLQELLDEGKEEEAESQWQRVQGLLQQWKGVKGVEAVKQACEKVMETSEQEDEDEAKSDAG